MTSVDATDERGLVLTPAARRRSLTAVIGAMACMAMFYGYAGPLLSVVLDTHGIGGWLIGANAASQMLAILVAAPLVPRLIMAFGPARVMTAGILVAIVAFAVMAVFVNVWLWFPLRFVMGAAQSSMWTSGETWINHVALDHRRGRTIATYSMAIAIGFATGPFIEGSVGIEGWQPYAIACAMMALAILPLLLSYQTRVEARGGPVVRLSQYVRMAPLPMFANMAFSMIASSLLALMAVYGLRLGMGESRSIELIGWMGWGGALMPLVIGPLADRVDRRLLLTVIVALGATAALAMPFLASFGAFIWAYLMLYGGLRSAHYSLAVMLLGERFRGADLPSATAVFGVMYGLGSFVGPQIAGLGIEAWDPYGLPLVLAAIYLLFLPWPLIAWLRKRRGAV